MSGFDYSKLAAKTAKILDRFDQGNIFAIRPGEPTGPDWDPRPGDPVVTPLKAVAFGVSKQYIDGLITGADIEVTAAPWGEDPDTSHTIRIGAREHEIIRINRIPAAGTLVAWQIFVKG